jgi:hypothetical protein
MADGRLAARRPLATRLLDHWLFNNVSIGHKGDGTSLRCPYPMTIEPGDIVKTNYNGGPYRFVYIHRGCTCPNNVESLNAGGQKLPPAPEHIHITGVAAAARIRWAQGEQDVFLNRYLEKKGRIKSVDTEDEIFGSARPRGQMRLS